jgi:ankyrin repeat protein
MNEKLLKAIGEGNLEEVEELFRQGADVHLDYEYALKLAERNGHLNIIEYLVSKGASVNDDLLFFAALDGYLDIVKYLAEHGVNIHAHDNIALRVAESNSHLDVVEYLKSIDK